jgi:hypothetical protein
MDPDMIFDAGYLDVGFDDDDDYEVGRRGRARKRFRRAMGAMFGGPAGIAAVARRRRRDKSAERAATVSARAGSQLRLASAGIPVTEGKNLLVSGQRRQTISGALQLATGTAGDLIIRVAKPFQVEKIVAVATDVVTGADVSRLTTITRIDVGVARQQGNVGNTVVSAFGPDVQNNLVMWDPLMPGLDLTVGLVATQPVNATLTTWTCWGYTSL